MTRKKEELRRAVAEGCNCCRGSNHNEHGEKLAKLLDVPLYSDGSGYDFNQFATKPV